MNELTEKIPAGRRKQPSDIRYSARIAQARARCGLMVAATLLAGLTIRPAMYMMNKSVGVVPAVVSYNKGSSRRATSIAER